jgi:hypothetical protein
MNTTGQKFGGRKRGTANKTGAQIKSIIQKILSGELSNVDDLVSKLTAKERLDVIIKLLPYIIPKQSTIDVELNDSKSLFTPIEIRLLEP